MSETGEMLIQGAIDLHVHTAPDICTKKVYRHPAGKEVSGSRI